MNELQAEKKAIQNALESIRANDAKSSNPSPEKPQRRISAPTFPSASFEVSPFGVTDSLSPYPTLPNRSYLTPQQTASQPAPQTSLPELQTAIQNAIQTALQNSSAVGSVGSSVGSFQENSLVQNVPATVNESSPTTRTPRQQLEAQAKHLNQLSQNQEAALRRLQSIAAQIDQERRKAERAKLLSEKPLESDRAKGKGEAASHRPPVKLSLPLQPISLPPIELPAEANEAAHETAQLLRQLQERREYPEEEYQEQFVPIRKSRRRSTLVRRLRRWLSVSSASRHSSQGSLSSRSSHRQAVASAEQIPFTLRETLTLLLGAALTRLLLNLLLEAVPLLTIPTLILLIVPAAIAVYRTTTTPQSGIIWGYRICMILLGLLIGGRL